MKTAAINTWVNYYKPNPQARLRLFCFPYAGGSASLFRGWAEHLPVKTEVCPVQLPGRESRFKEQAYSALPPLIEELANALNPALDMPFAFFGHSMGALIAFELTRYLAQRTGLHPRHLFISAHRAPQLPDSRPSIYHLADSAFIEELRHLNGTPREVLANEELMELLLPQLRADFTLVETYRYVAQEPLSCPISAFGGWQDTEVKQEEIAAWRVQTANVFSLHMLPGDHFFLHSNRSSLFQVLSQELTTIVSAIAGE
jgi:medium-chain acyl-[acyl-carrier-protein] hydrolase